jgi:two-component system chemotaxis response regulator CheB
MPAEPVPARAAARHPVEVVLVGGSAGALDALSELLPALPRDWRLPIVLVVHLPRRGPSALAEVLAAHTPLAVVEADDKQPLSARTLHVARAGYHLLVDEGPALALAVDDPEHFSMPSIDVLFESAAATCGAAAAAVVLSGANEDGARGLAAVRAAGGAIAVQAPDDATIDVMPRAALRACPDAAALPARALGEWLGALAAAGARG